MMYVVDEQTIGEQWSKRHRLTPQAAVHTDLILADILSVSPQAKPGPLVEPEPYGRPVFAYVLRACITPSLVYVVSSATATSLDEIFSTTRRKQCKHSGKRRSLQDKFSGTTSLLACGSWVIVQHAAKFWLGFAAPHVLCSCMRGM